MPHSRYEYLEVHENPARDNACFDTVHCEACGCCLPKDEAVRLESGEWLCAEDSYLIRQFESGKI